MLKVVHVVWLLTTSNAHGPEGSAGRMTRDRDMGGGGGMFYPCRSGNLVGKVEEITKLKLPPM